MNTPIRNYSTCQSKSRCVNPRQGSLTKDDYYENGKYSTGQTKYKLRCKECNKQGIKADPRNSPNIVKSMFCPSHSGRNGFDMKLAQRVICSPRIAI